MRMPVISAVGLVPENLQKSIDTLKGHCDTLGRDYDSIEKTTLATANLSGDDSVKSIISRIKQFAELGFSHTIFNIPDLYTGKPLETFAKEIIPAVAEL